MTLRRVVMSVCWALLLAAAVPLAQSRSGSSSEGISGTWVDTSDGNQGRGLELKYDGKGHVTGTVNPGRPNASLIKTGTFDPKTGALKLEGDAKQQDGSMTTFVIEGKLDQEVLSGTYAFGQSKGTFKFTRKK